MTMNNFRLNDPGSMSPETFSRFSVFVHDELGIKMPESKKTMLQSRLLKRLRASGKKTYEEYYEYVFSSGGTSEELAHLIDVITTNKTEFFREPKHFDFLVQTALPELIRAYGTGIRQTAKIWSAGCSTGQEPYTLAMVLSEFAAGYPGFEYIILGTDISTRVLEVAKLAIYNHEHVAPVAMALRKKYLLQSRDRSKRTVRIVPELRSRVRFKRLNFIDNDFGLSEAVDIIFCRNVLIYFDRPTQEMVLNRLCRHLKSGGYLFLGHSETLNGLDVPLVSAAPTIYRKPG
jgi:chemotaxis protein methyltransferase CheR